MVADDSLDSKKNQLYGIAPFLALFFVVLASFSKSYEHLNDYFIKITLYN